MAALKNQFQHTDPFDHMNDLVDSVMAPASPVIPPGGTWYFVDAASGSDSNAGTEWDSPKATIASALASCTANQHDVVCLLASASGTSETAAIAWNKNFTHLVGIGAPTHAAQRTRVVCGDDALSPFVTFSAAGCVVSNIYFWQGRDDATTLVNVSVTGERNFFYNCHFAGGGHATQAVDGGASLLINGGSENVFERCTIGIDTISAGNGMAGLVFAATGGAARNLFRNCLFTLYAGNAGAIFVEALGNSGLDRYHVFERCRFINLSATAMTQAFAIAAGFDANNKRLLAYDCELIGAADWDANDRGILYLNAHTRTGGGNAGIMLASAAT